MNMPTVSVIIPCFNQGKYIDDAVKSILHQTYQDFEIIIVNDGSTDQLTNQKLSAYNQSKTKVITIKNTGLPGARNRGIKEAKGKYILTLDADDKFAPTFLEKAVTILNKNKKVGVVSCYTQTFGLYKKIIRSQGGDVKNFLIENNCTSAALFHKICWKQVNGYTERMTKGFEDWDFWIKLTSRGWIVHIIKQPLFFYRVKEKSMYTKAQELYLELVKQIVLNNKKIFQENIDYVIYEKEKRFQSLYNSQTYRIGKKITSGYKIITSPFRKK
jgi:glycosyltransferase involved in cell wall biosynthesis